MGILDLEPCLSSLYILAHRLSSDACLLMCSYMDPTDTYWPGCYVTRPCADHLGGSREQNKLDSCPLESTDEWRIRGAYGQGPIGGCFAKDKAWSSKETEQSSQARCLTWAASWWKIAQHLSPQLLVARPLQLPSTVTDTPGWPPCYAEFRDPDTAERRVRGCGISMERLDKTGHDECECWVWWI